MTHQCGPEFYSLRGGDVHRGALGFEKVSQREAVCSRPPQTRREPEQRTKWASQPKRNPA
jgi:hypothetical protein